MNRIPAITIAHQRFAVRPSLTWAHPPRSTPPARAPETADAGPRELQHFLSHGRSPAAARAADDAAERDATAARGLAAAHLLLYALPQGPRKLEAPPRRRALRLRHGR
eukprot:CAMPEP_0174910520 /NCGR_PEP_ID=MMETSP0167-20121228/72951_1 /TAXON_ID=38298 /ORGANISM="Rhodella maculata, Strain CCMP736" /LENGTH=107 /DNA_ID=CAMNT_0016154811 /DNA_START=44 /DNA_END=364 /DNA_ORIENTATION=-